MLILSNAEGLRRGSKENIFTSETIFPEVAFSQHSGIKYRINCCLIVTKTEQPQQELTAIRVKKFLNPTNECRWQAVNELGTAGLLFQMAVITEKQRNHLATDKSSRNTRFHCKTEFLMSY
jgi:hypothetical protein